MIKPWRVVDSRETYRDQWITIRSDHCISDFGREIAPYHVIEYPNWINIVAITENLELILVRQYRHGVGDILMELPSGVIEPGDSNPQTAARRELAEETGYESDTFIELGSSYANPANQNNKVTSFLAINARETTGRTPDPNEDIEIVLEDAPRFLGDFFDRKIQLQGLHVSGLFYAISYILRCPMKELSGIRDSLLHRWDFHNT